MAASPFAVTFGVQLASSWVNMMLYMLEIVMCLRYFQRGTFHPLPHKIGVGAMIFFDTLCTMSVNADVFVTFLVIIGQDRFAAFTVPAAMSIFFTYFTALIEQFFLCHLYFIITRRWAVALFLAFLGLVHVGFSFAAATMLVVNPTSPLTFTITGVGASGCGITDLLIASCLGYELYKLKRTHASNSKVLRRIFILSITSGAIVASTTLLMMMLLLKGSIAFDFFFSCQGRIYALTLLLNFLSGTSSSGTTVGSDHPNGVFSIGPKFGGAPIRSTASDVSINKELPPLPATPSLRITTSTLPPYLAYAHYPSSSLGAPQTPRTPRTIITAPYRVGSLPH
ncbi:hypothetical protein B0H12DRAFT_685102 [Mycena haematopus]|nr:hypothetical protein B0H12DRAFT_685102 [Mycena haematopus]